MFKFYFTRPVRFYDFLSRGAQSAFDLRPNHLGNFEKATVMSLSKLSPSAAASLGSPCQSQAFTLWSSFKSSHLPHTLGVILAFLLVSFAAVAIKYYRFDKTPSNRLLSQLHALVLILAVFAFFTVILGKGDLDIVKQLFLFSALFDIAVIFGIMYLAALAVALCRKLVYRP